MDDLRQLTYAAALFSAFGGYREVAWGLAGELVAEGVDAQALFLGCAEDGPLADRHSLAHKQHLAAQR